MTTAPMPLGPADYFRARLDYEIAPVGLKRILDRTPSLVCVLDVE